MAAVDDFRDSVISLKPGNFMALNGSAPGILGTMDSGSATILQLQRSVVEFTRLYKTNTAAEVLQAARRDVTSKIMVAVTVDAMSEKRADELLDAMEQLMKGRK